MPAADFCGRVRVNYFTLSRESATCRRSPVISSTAFDTRPPDLPPTSLMDTDFAVACPLVRRRKPQIRFLSIGRYLLLHASFRPHLTVTPLRFATLHLHQVGDFHPLAVDPARRTRERAGETAGPLLLGLRSGSLQRAPAAAAIAGFSTFTLICFGLASSRFGMLSVSTPF